MITLDFTGEVCHGGIMERLEPKKPRKLPRWREAERYFKRYRDTQKVTLPRMQTPMLSQMLYSDGTVPVMPILTQDEGCGKVNS